MEILKILPSLISFGVAFVSLFIGLKSTDRNVRMAITLIAIAQIISAAIQIATIHFRW